MALNCCARSSTSSPVRSWTRLPRLPRWNAAAPASSARIGRLSRRAYHMLTKNESTSAPTRIPNASRIERRSGAVTTFAGCSITTVHAESPVGVPDAILVHARNVERLLPRQIVARRFDDRRHALEQATEFRASVRFAEPRGAPRQVRDLAYLVADRRELRRDLRRRGVGIDRL